MKRNVTLMITSLLSINFAAFHITDEIARGLEKGGLSNVFPVLVLALWLYGALVLVDRRSGHIIILVGSLLGVGIPVLHMMGSGLAGPRIIATGRVFFWVWNCYALGVTSAFSLALSAWGIWKMRR
jgi:hypothetical protein